jgi:hypothetical protein
VIGEPATEMMPPVKVSATFVTVPEPPPAGVAFTARITWFKVPVKFEISAPPRFDGISAI